MKKLIFLLSLILIFILSCTCAFAEEDTTTAVSAETTIEATTTEPATTVPTTTQPTTTRPTTTQPTTTQPTTKPAVKLATPTGLAFSSATATSITLRWNAVAGAEIYEIYCGISGIDGYTLAGKSSGTSFTITGLNGSNRYKIKVKATANGKPSSDRSELIRLYTLPPRAAKPSRSSADGASVTLKWNRTGRENYYDIYVSSSQEGKYKKIATTKNNTYTYEHHHHRNQIYE